MVRQVDLYFRLDKRRWSERYYLAPPDAEPLEGTLQKLFEARADLLGTFVYVESGRIIDLANPQNRFSKYFNYRARFWLFPWLPILQQPGAFSMIPEVSVGMAFRAAGGAHRVLWLSGIPDQRNTFNDINARIVLNNFYQDRLDKFRDTLTSPPFSLQLRALEQTPEDGRRRVLFIDQGDGGRYRITTDAAHLFEPGDRVRVLGSRGDNLTRMRGLRRVDGVPSPTQLLLDRGPVPEIPLRYTGGAKLDRVGYVFKPATWYSNEAGEFKTPLLGLDILGHTNRWRYLVASKLRSNGPARRRGRAKNRT